jgi:hypothetical protein
MAKKAAEKNGILESIKGIWKSELSKKIKSKKDLTNLNSKNIINAVKEKNKNKEQSEIAQKQSQTIGVVSVLPQQYYPLVESKAALLNQVSGLSTIPLMIECKHPKELSKLLQPLTPSFSAMLVIGIRDDYLNEIRKSKTGVQLITDIECEAATIVAAVLNAAQLLKKQPKSLNIVISGSDTVLKHTIEQLLSMGITNITLVDEIGSLYIRRKKMNKAKIELLKMLKNQKCETLEATLKRAHIIITSEPEFPSKNGWQHVSKNSVLINTSTTAIKSQTPKASIDAKPGNNPYISDLIAASIILKAQVNGYKIQENTYNKISETIVKQTPKATKNTILPYVLDNKRIQKIADAVK